MSISRMSNVDAPEQQQSDREFSLDQVITGVTHKPPRIVVYGVDGIGKSTLAADAPNPIFLQTEEGANEIDVPKLPTALSHGEVMAQLRLLYKGKHSYETVVIDSVDWLEDFIHLDLKASYSEKELSYGKDSIRAAEKVSEVLTALNHLRDRKGMGCVLISHSEIKRFNSPLSEPYDRYQANLQSRLGALVQQWADLVLFCTFEVHTKSEDAGFNRKVVRGVSTGNRVMYTEERPGFHAKNRYGMPVELPLLAEHPFAALAKHIPFYAAKEGAAAKE